MISIEQDFKGSLDGILFILLPSSILAVEPVDPRLQIIRLWDFLVDRDQSHDIYTRGSKPPTKFILSRQVVDQCLDIVKVDLLGFPTLPAGEIPIVDAGVVRLRLRHKVKELMLVAAERGPRCQEHERQHR